MHHLQDNFTNHIKDAITVNASKMFLFFHKIHPTILSTPIHFQFPRYKLRVTGALNQRSLSQSALRLLWLME